MLKNLYPAVLAAALALTGFGAHAQTSPAGRTRAFCGFDEQQQAYFAAHPGARLLYDAVNQQLAAMPAPAQQRGGLAVPNVTIPVVVHIIHAGGVDNISDRQINSAIAELNDDYQKLNADTTALSPLFIPIAANLQFQFKLAKLDPNGNCTTGITRTYAPELVNDDRAGAVKARIFWDSNRYLNMWIVSTIGTPVAGGGFILGYAQFPGQNAATDGLVMRHDYFGNQGTASPATAAERTATHEVGHYFGLLHTWGNGAVETPGNCGGTDFVADTPPTIGTFGCNLNMAPCGVVANVNNYMDYSACTSMFTQGQKSRMLNVLSTIRTGLTTATNVAATGTSAGYVAPNCAPVAAFAPLPGTSTKVCINTPVTLRDYSYNFTAAGGQLAYTWSAPGATFVGTPGQTVTLSYAAAGIYSVTETVTNTAGSGTSTQTNLIVVEGPTGAETAPYAESFENAAFPNLFAAPSLRNYETFGTTGAGGAAPYRWNRRTALLAANGTAYLLGANRLYPTNAVTTLITPNINLSGVTQPAVLRLARAYALRNTTDNAQLRVSFSSNCGVSWSSPTVLTVADLATKGLTPIDGFYPAVAADWQDLTVVIPAQFQGSGLFKVRLELVNGATQGNDFYLDNLRVVNVLGTKADALAARGISVYPNPLTRETAVHLTLAAATQVQVRLTDVLGRDVLTLPARTYGAGPLALPLQAAGRPLRAGLYVVRLTLNGEAFSSKLTVE